ncbi:MAG TPA: SurA N-terminal domain-containing protein [Desulfuromonadales bacterium]|nr:SurA N-terminal domain-containing protein [Desulfuromonadales bacterium]
MLDLIRKKQKTLIVKVVFWVIIAAFVGTIFLVWGRGGDQAGERSAAAVVNGERISYNAYQSSYDNLYRLYQNIYQEQFTPAMERQLGLKEQALQMLIEQVLLAQEAERQGITVSQEEVVEAIAQVPEFQENGTFSKQRYLSVLNYQRIDPEEFEAAKRRELRIEKLRAQLQEGITVGSEEIEEEFRQRNEKVSLRFLRFAPALFEGKVDVDKGDLRAFFDKNKETFRLPERLSLEYLQFEPARYEDEIVLNEEDLNSYYQDNLDKFDVDEQVRASHILIKVDEDADEQTRKKKKALAEEILTRLRDGADFSELARQFSEDPGSAASGGDIGLFARGTMAGPFEEAAFNLPVDEISDLVETRFGYHIIKVTERVEAGVKPLSEVADEVETAAKKEKAIEMARDRAWTAYSKYKDTADLETAAENNNLGVKETGFFPSGGVIDGIGRSEEIARAAFDLDENSLAKPVDYEGDIYLFTIKEREASHIPDFEEVKAEVEAAYRAEQSQKLAAQAAREALSALKAGKGIHNIDRVEGTEVEKTEMFNRDNGAFIPGLGTSKQLAQEAFALTEENPVAPEVYEVGGNYVVATLKDRQVADMEELDETRRQRIRETLLAEKKEEALTEEIEELRKDAEIEILVTLNGGR